MFARIVWVFSLSSFFFARHLTITKDKTDPCPKYYKKTRGQYTIQLRMSSAGFEQVFDSEELIASGLYPDFGRIIYFASASPKDLNIALMKSDTATLLLPDLDIEIPPGKGRYTTIEEFLREIYEDLQHSAGYFVDPAQKEGMQRKLEFLYKMIRGEESCKLVIRDPLGNITIECENEKKVQIEDFVRSRDDCAELGVPFEVNVNRPKGG